MNTRVQLILAIALLILVATLWIEFLKLLGAM